MKWHPRASALVALALLASCQKKEEAAPAPTAAPAPPPLPAAAPAPTPTPTPAPAPEAPAATAPMAAQPTAIAPTAAAAGAPAPSGSAEPDKKTAAVVGPSIKGCCAALAAEAKKGGRTQNQYTAAVAVCNGLDSQLKKGAANLASAKVTLRAQLSGVPVPGGC